MIGLTQALWGGDNGCGEGCSQFLGGEVFGIWGLMWKLSAVTTFPFAWVKDTVGTAQALLVLAAFLTVGLVLTLRIDERRGLAAANEP